MLWLTDKNRTSSHYGILKQLALCNKPLLHLLPEYSKTNWSDVSMISYEWINMKSKKRVDTFWTITL